MCPGLKSIRAAYYKTLDINICNNYIDQFTEAMCSKKSKYVWILYMICGRKEANC